MTSASEDVSAIAAAVSAFFAKKRGASLRLPTGWFGRPNDNFHQLTEVRIENEHLLIRIDGRQILTLQADSVFSDEHVLRIAIRGGRWEWTGYGGNQEHTEVLPTGNVEFHAIHPS